ncbi:PspC domain-containing protein [Actinokineospora sp.]|uniref:PspC domain-containing protein n=1 Tax=Actinokineospora sp. TaxID=1872133 RepID=UPI0040378FCD
MEDTLKDFWATRPRRPRRGRKIAGVAAAIGNRYGIDPIIARVALVVAAFYGGAGVLFYLLGWLFFAEEDDEVSPAEALHGKGRSSSSIPFTIVLCLAMIPAFTWFYGDFSGLFGTVIGFGLLFLLHRHRGHLGTPTTPPPVAAGMPMAVPVGAYDQTDQYPTTPPAWDPLGAAPFAWDLPEPSSVAPDPEPPAPRHRSKVGAVTLAAVFLTVGAAVLAEPYLGGWVTAQHVIGVVLGILGMGMWAGSFTRSGRGLIGLAVPLSAAGIALTVVWPNGFTADGVGDIDARPLSIEQVDDQYRRNIGSVNLDLTALPNAGSVETEVGADVGDVTVIVPENADVFLKCAVGVGEVTCLGEQSSGPGAEIAKTDFGADGEGGLRIELDVEVSGPGSVEVRRG